MAKIWLPSANSGLRRVIRKAAGANPPRADVEGRCRRCEFFEACGGSLKVRADLHFRDPWTPDPACYLTDTEIGLDVEKQDELRRTREAFEMPD